jgi:hypothetical protein
VRLVRRAGIGGEEGAGEGGVLGAGGNGDGLDGVAAGGEFGEWEADCASLCEYGDDYVLCGGYVGDGAGDSAVNGGGPVL